MDSFELKFGMHAYKSPSNFQINVTGRMQNVGNKLKITDNK